MLVTLAPDCKSHAARCSRSENVGTKGNADRLCKRVHESRGRQTRDPRQCVQGQIIEPSLWLAKVVQNPLDSGMYRGATPATEEKCGQPAFGAGVVRRAAKHGAPLADLAGGNASNLAFDASGERRTQIALRADKSNQ